MKYPIVAPAFASNYKPVSPAPHYPFTLSRGPQAHTLHQHRPGTKQHYLRLRVKRARHPSCKRLTHQAVEAYFPASRFAVIKPTLSMPEPRMMSMALAT